MIWDQHNQVGGAGSVLIAAGAGVSWSRSLGANDLPRILRTIA